MIYSKFYKKHCPFKSSSDVLSLNEKERKLLLKYIKGYPFRAVEKIRRSWKYGIEVKEYPRKGGWIGVLLPSLGASDILIEWQQKCNELALKIDRKELLAADDVAALNLILYSNKYNPLLSYFIFP